MIVDQLVDVPIQGDHPLVVELLNESIFHAQLKSPWKLYFDGSHSSHGSRGGILFITPQGDSIPKSFCIAFPCTNNDAEYEALVIGLKMAIKWKIKTLQVYRDSLLVINQVNDEYDTKDKKLMP